MDGPEARWWESFAAPPTWRRAIHGHSGFILALGGVAALVALLVESTKPRRYEATADLVILSVRSEASLAVELKTKMTDAGAVTPARQETLVEVASSPAVAARVLATSSERLGRRWPNPSDLQQAVEVSSRGELISVRASAPEPALAADLANAWAREAERKLNGIYSESLQDLPEIQEALAQTLAVYQGSQAALELFLRTSRLSEIEYAIQHREHVLSMYEQLLKRIRQARVLARLIERQQEGPGASPAADWAMSLAFVQLQQQLNSDDPPVPGVELQAPIGATPPRLGRDDVRRFAALLAEQEAEIGAAIGGTEPRALPAPADAAHKTAIARPIPLELSELKAEREGVKARQRELENGRDVAWQTYQVLVRKASEVERLQRVRGSEVRVATEALPPTEPVGRAGLATAVLAGLVGLVVGVAIAVARLVWSEGRGRAQAAAAADRLAS